jgi:hypothetical protein
MLSRRLVQTTIAVQAVLPAGSSGALAEIDVLAVRPKSPPGR